MSRIILASYMTRYPLGGMLSYTLQWLVGLHDAGHDVYLVEKSDYPQSCYDVANKVMTDDCTYGTGVVSALLASVGLADRWCFVDASGVFHGLSAGRVSELFKTADVFIDLGNHGAWDSEASRLTRVLIDGEPAYTQMKMANRESWGESLPVYDYYFTVGQNIGTARSTAPTAGRRWRPIFYPVALELFNAPPPPSDAPFTTVMNWQARDVMEFEGRRYGQKDVEFQRFLDLPRLTEQPIEVAVAGKNKPLALLQSAGWRVRDAQATTISFDSYREYIAASRGEFSICKNVYVATCSGWFGDRSAAYLASGRPVVMQETGFSAALPCGEGLFAVSTAEEAADAIDRVARDYAHHSRAARRIAEEHLTTTKVLTRFLNEIGLGVQHPAATLRGRDR